MLVHLSHVYHSLYQLTSPNTAFVWTDAHNNAFWLRRIWYLQGFFILASIQQKRLLYTLMLLSSLPVEFFYNTDTLCAFKTLTNAQKILPTIRSKQELFGFAFYCKKFRIYLHGHPFQAFTDHKPLVGPSKKLDGIDHQCITAKLFST